MVEMLSLLQPVWDLAKHIPFANYILFPSLVALASFLLHSWLFTIYDALILKRVGVKEMLIECALPQTILHIVLNTLSFVLYPRVWELPEKAPTTTEFLIGIVMCYVVGDFLIYWEHVFMHRLPWFRHNIHATHHKYTSPMFSFNAGWVHPIEILVAALCELAFPFAAKVHPLTLWVFLWTWIFWLVEEHSGDDVWFSLWNLLPLVGGGAPPHNLHHAPHLTRNFGFVFSCWDRLFGTFEQPIGQSSKQTEKMA